MIMMKAINIFILLMFLVGFCCCDDEENIHVEEEGPRRDYDINSTDPVKKIVSEFFFNTGKEFIVDPDSSDYLYNFAEKNGVKMYPVSDANRDYLLSTVQLIKSGFLDCYTTEFVKENFPYSVIIADTIYDTGTYLTPKIVDNIARINYYGVNVAGKANLDLAEQKAFLALVHYDFFNTYLCVFKDMCVGETFESVYEKKSRVNDKHLTEEEGYAEGFVTVSTGTTWLGSKYTDFPSVTTDLKNTFIFFLTKDSDEYTRVTTTYPKIKEKCDAIITDLTNLGIDYKKLFFNGIN